MKSPMPRHMLLVVAALYYAGAKLGMMTVMPEGTALLWLPNAVVLAALVRYGGSRWFALALTVVLTEVAADLPTFTLTEAVLFGLINASESLLAFVLLRRFGFDARLPNPAHLVKFLVAGPLVAALYAALLGGLVYATLRGGDTNYLEFVRIWWFGDGLGLLILVPPLLGFPPFRIGRRSPLPRFRVTDAVVSAMAVAAVALLWTSSSGQFSGVSFGPMLLLPFTLYAAFRLPGRWVGVVVVLFSLAVILAMTQGKMPFGDLPVRTAVIHAQEFMFVMALMAVGLSALLAQLRSARSDLEAKVSERTLELEEANRRLGKLVLIDSLTGLYNRRGILEIAERELAVSRRTGTTFALLLLDLDGFKEINDEHGHLAGDAILVHCAERIRRETRATELCGRYGGDELIIVAPHTDLDGARILAERIAASLRSQPLIHDDRHVAITTSIGAVVLEPDDHDLRDVIERADRALYEAKAEGGDRVIARHRTSPEHTRAR